MNHLEVGHELCVHPTIDKADVTLSARRKFQLHYGRQNDGALCDSGSEEVR